MIIPKPNISVWALVATGNILLQRHRYSSKRDFSVKSPGLFGDFTETFISAQRCSIHFKLKNNRLNGPIFYPPITLMTPAQKANCTTVSKRLPWKIFRPMLSKMPREESRVWDVSPTENMKTRINVKDVIPFTYDRDLILSLKHPPLNTNKIFSLENQKNPWFGLTRGVKEGKTMKKPFPLYIGKEITNLNEKCCLGWY